ncbi:MAG TPA: GIY-YIG nuclease family protein [Polyangiaceae bacterium]|nr:GIY-YIG nuclease family protein [Polyangiaceae bacterium]
MSGVLRELSVLSLDCQASGASPSYGDLIELGWAICTPAGLVGGVRSTWILPRTERRVPRAVRELTGWSEACSESAIDETRAWNIVRGACSELGPRDAPAPTVIHFARFELAFLRDLHERLGDAAFPLDAVCVHAIAERLFPDLPRRSLRALAGFLGHSPELIRRAAGHVEATAFIWRALIPLLEGEGVTTWTELKQWLEQPAARSRRTRRQFPFDAERRRALPDRPGVYRFVRKSGDILYVGKATSLKKRVAGHFKSKGPATERGLELLTQVHDIVYTETASLLEAALLETDEIKRIDPPYNVQLRAYDRRAWFASRDLTDVVDAPGAAHPVGPLPSERAVSPLPALAALLRGEAPTARLRAMALAVPSAFAPDDALFLDGWSGFCAEVLDRLGGTASPPLVRVERAARGLWLERGRAESDAAPEDAPPDFWDLARVRRRLERSLVQSGLLLRRARFLCLLADATVAFRERAMIAARALVMSSAALVESADLDSVHDLTRLAARKPHALGERRRSFDAAAYDRLRVILTELCRIRDEGGEMALAVGGHVFAGERLSRLMLGV